MKRLRREEAFWASKVSRRLTGNLEEPGMVDSGSNGPGGGAWWWWWWCTWGRRMCGQACSSPVTWQTTFGVQAYINEDMQST